METTELIVIIVPVLSLTALIIFILTSKKITAIPQQPITIQTNQPNQGLNTNNETIKLTLPHRIDAYQRLVLFLERISPNSLVMRKFGNYQTAKQLQQDLLSTIRSEYEHNIAQQVFVSPQGWKMIKDSKEQIIQLINVAASQVEENASAIDLSSKIFELTAEFEKLPSEIATEFLVEELQKLF
jgi:hypothetical protein